MKRFLFIVLSVLAIQFQTKAQSCPVNIGFEQANFTNWTCFFGSVATGSPQLGLTTPLKGIHSLYTPVNKENFLNTTYHTPIDTLDSFATINNKKVLTTYCPFTGNHAVKIGNASPYTGGPGQKATGLMYVLQVPFNAPHFKLTYYYAVVLHQAAAFPHAIADQPYFQVSVTDTFGNTIGNTCNQFKLSFGNINTGWTGCKTPNGADSISFKNWSSNVVDLTGYAGQTVYLQFFVTDCTQGGHFGYAYIDIDESNCKSQNTITTKYCKGSSSVTTNVPSGFKSYTWWDEGYVHQLGNTQNLSFTPPPADSSLYYLSLKPYVGCEDSSTVLVRAVSPLHKITTIYGDSVVCAGKQIYLYDSTKGYNATPNVIGIWGTNTIGKSIIGVSSTKGVVIGKSTGYASVKYTFTDSAYPYCADSTFYIVHVLPADTMKISIIASQNPAINNTPITFNAITSLTGSAPTYQWYKNGIAVGLNTTTYIDSFLQNKDSVWCVVNGGTFCAVSNSVHSNTIRMSMGTAAYTLSGNIITPAGKPVVGAKVIETGYYNNAFTTDSLGHFAIKAVTGSYTFKATKSNNINKANGISTIDAALVQSHVLQKTVLNSPYKIIAADVNGDGKVSALDIVIIKRMILGLDTIFPGNKLWVFIDTTYHFPNAAQPFPYKDSISYTGLSASYTNLSFLAIKLGDVNWDWNPLLPKKPLKYKHKQQLDLVKEEE